MAESKTVNGTLTIEGQPVENVLVTFYPAENPDSEKLAASGLTNANGEFTLTRDDDEATSIATGNYFGRAKLSHVAGPPSVASGVCSTRRHAAESRCGWRQNPLCLRDSEEGLVVAGLARVQVHIPKSGDSGYIKAK